MARDHRKLRVFAIADRLALGVYRATGRFPDMERYGLTSQRRRAAVSAACNIVEGSARRTVGQYVSFLDTANGSAHEVRYFIELSRALGYLSDDDFGRLHTDACALSAGLGALLKSFDMPLAQKPET